MATVYGPDQYSVPTGPDAPDVPATIITLLDSMRPSLIGHASSIADRSAKYGRASASSIQAPVGTVVVSAEMSAIWVKTSSTLDQWATIIQHSDEVINSGTSFIPSDISTKSRDLTIPEDGIYSIFADANEPSWDASDGKIREMIVAQNGVFKFGGILPGTQWWHWTGSRMLTCRKGDSLTLSVMQRSGAPKNVETTLSYQRIL
ncbi:hypothetical protein FAM19024_001852 [Propionibacterium freudenreichii]|uniref:hypothetical protein n=1 Tax=Propionibacterium freudenreichii TaxID=1744 RepID=UPI00243447FD|nr:hypothetical protein [Propionibacterium freudenreichii]WFF32391.1 hypothetical protein FAM19024_001852 [Propionibacterium freudenreichii]